MHLGVDVFIPDDAYLHAFAELVCDWDTVEILAVGAIVHRGDVEQDNEQREDTHSTHQAHNDANDLQSPIVLATKRDVRQ